MNKYLTQKIWKMREEIKTKPGTPYVSLNHVEGGVYQLLFTSCGCNNACTFCNYGFDYNLTLEMCKPQLEKIRLEDYPITTLELEANGSFLREKEIPYDLFLYVLNYVSNKGIPNITIETFFSTITENKLKDIRKILGKDQNVDFEIGFETSNTELRSKAYNKDFRNEDVIEKAKLIKKYNMTFEVNFLLGAPFLSREEQIQDTLNSIDYVFRNFPKNTICVLFPINIKQRTMLAKWQELGLYDEISSWEFVELLHRIPIEYMDKITIAWWGNRENTFAAANSQQFPKDCDKCHKMLLDFYKEFYCNWNPLYRKNITEKIWQKHCTCDIV